MSRTWTPKKKTVDMEPAARPSRIRREPVRAAEQVEPKPRNREREMWLGVGGIALMGTALAALAVGVSDSTSRLSGSASAGPGPQAGFQHCYNAGAADCVLDGDTIFLGGQRIEIAIDSPEINGALCPEERQLGIAAANRLRELLDSGEVKLTGTVSQADGTIRHNLSVDGADVGKAMIAAGAARPYGSGQGWC